MPVRPAAPAPELVARARAMDDLLAGCYPDAAAELDFTSPVELLVATVLSAQSTDRRVNAVTPALFARYRTPLDYAQADPAELEDLIRPTGFFRSKAAAVIGLGRALVDRFDSQVPRTLEELTSLPGVGRKTANVVLGNAFGVPGITPDTHFMRVTRRMGWTTETSPDGIETTVGDLFDPENWVGVSHRVIWHGRRRCHARTPACGACPVVHLCPSAGLGPLEADTARRLVREPRR